jgi:hypothetical protein
MKQFLLLALCLPLLAVGAHVNAESRGTEQSRPTNGMGHMKTGDMRTASSSTDRPEKGEKPEMRKAIPGIVTSVSSTGFTMTGRGQGKNHATTTLTVVVTPSTIFKIRNMMIAMGRPQMVGSTTQTGSTTPPMMATTTGSLADVIVGSKVEVFGKISTSTNTITADKVHINRGKGEGRENDKMEKGHSMMGSSTSRTEDRKPGFMEKFKNFFGGSTSASGTPPAGGPASAGFIDFLSHALFGWFK